MFLAVAGSVLAIGAVHPWAYVPLWILCAVLALILAYRTFTLRWLRRELGAHPVGLHAFDSCLVVSPGPADPTVRWRIDLSAPPLALGPLWLPGAALAIWILLQLAPLPAQLVARLSPGQLGLMGVATEGWRPLTLSPEATLRGLGFVLALLAVHAVAASVLSEPDAGWRFVARTAWLGCLLGLFGIVQQASGTQKIYGFFQPKGQGLIFGPFVNRNHFAGYMLLCLPLAVLALSRAWARFLGSVSGRPGLRRRLVALAGPGGGALPYAVLPPIFIGTALLASMSRGAIIACLGGLALAVLARRRETVLLWGVGAAVAAVLVSWLGVDRLERHFAAAPGDAAQRTIIWKASLERLRGFWLVGSGFNTFSEAINRPRLWWLPLGASPLEAPAPRPGDSASGTVYRKLMIGADGRNFGWFSDAHNDYLQAWFEAGLPGLFLSLWASLAALRFVRGNPWLLAAIASVLAHELVDFDLQIPAIAVLFACVATLRLHTEHPDRSADVTVASA